MVFSCDVDRSGDALGDLLGEPEFWGASGCGTAALGNEASRQHSSARMHMPAEFRHSDPASDCSIGDRAFGFDQDGSRGIISHGGFLAEGGAHGWAGSNSHSINSRIINPGGPARSRVYNAQVAVVDELLYGADLDPQALSVEAAAQLNRGGLVGLSSVDRNVACEVYADRKKCNVPRRDSKIAEVLNPSPHDQFFIKEHEQKFAASLGRQLYTKSSLDQPAGLSASETNENASREMVHLDGDPRQAKRVDIAGGDCGANASAGLGGSQVAMSRIYMPDAPPGRSDYTHALEGASGKSSGMGNRSHNNSNDLKVAIRGDEAYARALGAGREMLGTPYSPAKTNPGGTAYRSSLSGNGGALAPAAPAVLAYGVQTDTAGNFEKEGLRRKHSMSQSSAYSPFATTGRDDRFLTSSSSIGSGVAWAPDQRPQSADGRRGADPTSTALVPSAGARSMWQPHRAFSAAGPS